MCLSSEQYVPMLTLHAFPLGNVLSFRHELLLSFLIDSDSADEEYEPDR